jgi:hypothetical protein
MKLEIIRMLRKKIANWKCKRSVILVDEILKTREFGDDFANQCRSALCKLADTQKDICGLVIFSSLEVDFMIDEVKASGRPMDSVCVLPLLTVTEAFTIMLAGVNCMFVDEDHFDADKTLCLQQLAYVSGGHPRSIEYIIAECNIVNSSGGKISLSKVIKRSGKNLAAAYRMVENYDALVKTVLLGKEVRTTDVNGSETFVSLVNRGVLLNSFDQYANRFVPVCPELFLHAWVNSPRVISDNIRHLLGQILDLRGHFTRKRFENVHCDWEQLIRHCRPMEYAAMPLHEVYGIHITENVHNVNCLENSVLCPVDARTPLSPIRYRKNAEVAVSLNTIFSPIDDYNPGWDRLIFYEAFPHGRPSRNKYTLPVFIQNKFSTDKASTKLSLAVVTALLKTDSTRLINMQIGLYPFVPTSFCTRGSILQES